MPKDSLKIIFMGTPDFASQTLEALIKSKHDIIAVYSQPPRPKGRGHKVQKSPVHELAQAHNIPVFTPKALKSKEEQEHFAAQKADVAVVAAYGLLLPKAVLEAPRYGCLNIHGSLLPRWRGASPIQHAIWKGDEKSGITIMQMDIGMDTGAMIAKSEITLGTEMTTSKLHDALAKMGAASVLNVLEKLGQERKLETTTQEEAYAIYAPLLKKEDGVIDWRQIADEIDAQIRALNPWPGVWTAKSANKTENKEAQRFKILEARPQTAPYPTQEPLGTILNKNGEIMCSDKTILKIIKIQPEGKKAMDFPSALNGNYISVGEVFK